MQRCPARRAHATEAGPHLGASSGGTAAACCLPDTCSMLQVYARTVPPGADAVRLIDDDASQQAPAVQRPAAAVQSTRASATADVGQGRTRARPAAAAGHAGRMPRRHSYIQLAPRHAKQALCPQTACCPGSLQRILEPGPLHQLLWRDVEQLDGWAGLAQLKENRLAGREGGARKGATKVGQREAPGSMSASASSCASAGRARCAARKLCGPEQLLWPPPSARYACTWAAGTAARQPCRAGIYPPMPASLGQAPTRCSVCVCCELR